MKILLSCYDVRPYRGSEASVGWNFSLSLAKKHEVVVIANLFCKEDIDKYFEVIPGKVGWSEWIPDKVEYIDSYGAKY